MGLIIFGLVLFLIGAAIIIESYIKNDATLEGVFFVGIGTLLGLLIFCIGIDSCGKKKSNYPSHISLPNEWQSISYNPKSDTVTIYRRNDSLFIEFINK